MWFIIIFSSIPVIRPLLTQIGHKLRRLAGYSTKSEQKAAYAPNDSWVELTNQRYKCQTDVDVRATPRQIGRGDSEEEILPRRGQIIVTRDTTVESTVPKV